MLDIQLLRTDLERVATRLVTRPFDLDANRFRELEARIPAITLTIAPPKAITMYRPTSFRVPNLKSIGHGPLSIFAPPT